VAAKIARQPNRLVILGAPTSAAAMSLGHEGAPKALRSAGLIEQLESAGYQVTDQGDDAPQLFQPDEDSPRARNVLRILKALETLKPRIELAVKSAALPIILSGDCSSAIALIAGMRRYYRNVSMIYMDSDADRNIPATTPSGCVDGMVVSHLTGRGAAELVRFWGEPPLVREPDLALFGVSRLDPPERTALEGSPLRCYMASDVRGMGAAAAARDAVERVHGNAYEFALHFDVDVIAGFTATNYPAQDGLSLEEVREALDVFVQQKHLAAIEIAAYNPKLDPDGSGANTIIDLLVSVMEGRRKFFEAQNPDTAPPSPRPEAVKPAPAIPEAPPPAGAPEPPAKAAAAVGEEDALVEPETLVSGEGVTDDVFSEAGDEIPDSDDNDETDGDLLPSDSEDTHS
jgi:arginase